jgi:aspartyl-tRNA(Asn)/glutamyl-tRNA(Gln) amidotransferase subunit B
LIPSIGLEVHAQINSKSKLFSRASTSYNAGVNENVDLFDASIPGTLPVLNEECLVAAIKTSVALNCSVNTESSFDRKHYFYGDLPLGYQITQSESPIGVNGFLDFVVFNRFKHEKAYLKTSKIKQLQLEQDSGKSLHDEINGISLIDLNRAGNPLMEIVFEPDLCDGEEASALIRDLILLLKSLDTCSCRMEEGSLRVDANISVRTKDTNQLGTRTEVKNLNSLKSIARAVDYEINRQISLLTSGRSVVNETMRFNSSSGKTEIMRDKEVVMDYRFMPEGNIPLIFLRDSKTGVNPDQTHLIDIHDFRVKIPPSPKEVREELMNKYRVSLEEISQLQSMDSLHLQWFTKIMDYDKQRNPSIVFRLLTRELEEVLEEKKLTLAEVKTLTAEYVGRVCDLVQSETISYLIAQDILGSYCDDITVDITEESIDSKGWRKIKKQEEITKHCQEIITVLPKRAKDVRLKGKKFAFDVLTEVVIKTSKRRIDRKDIESTLIDILKPPQGVILTKRERMQKYDSNMMSKRVEKL